MSTLINCYLPAIMTVDCAEKVTGDIKCKKNTKMEHHNHTNSIVFHYQFIEIVWIHRYRSHD